MNRKTGNRWGGTGQPAMPFFLLLLLDSGGWGCQRDDLSGAKQATSDTNPAAAAPVDVICTAWVHQAIVRQLAGDRLETRMMEPDGGFNANNRLGFFPEDNDLVAVQRAPLVIVNGAAVPWVSWPGMITLDDSHLCDTSWKFRLDDYIPVREHRMVHSHGPEGEHSHDYMVPYCWLDPRLLSLQVATIAARLEQVFPDRQLNVQEALARLVGELGKIEGEYRELGQAVDGRVQFRLATPDLLFVAGALGVEAEYELWFEPADEGVWRERMDGLQTRIPESGRMVVLWPGEVPPAVLRLANASLAIVGIDMMEGATDRSELTIQERLQKNLAILRQAAGELPENSAITKASAGNVGAESSPVDR